MIHVHDIRLPNPKVQEKLRYFADYFNFAAVNIGKMERLALDNHVSVLDKLLFHLGRDKRYRRDYVEAYLTHPLWSETKLVSGFAAYAAFERVRRKYPVAESASNKTKWIAANENALSRKGKALLSTLTHHLFRKTLDTIVARVRCRCNLEKHQEEIELLTRTLVAQYVFAGNSREDIVELFRRIITRDVKEYPFPKSQAKSSEDEKKQYLTNLKLPAQLKALHYHLQREAKPGVYMFRLIGISAADDFIFTYDKVTFIHPKHPKLARIFSQYEKDTFNPEYLNREDCLLATIRVKHKSSIEALLHAAEEVRSEMEYLKAQVGDQFFLDTKSHLVTRDYSRAWGFLSFDKGLTRIRSMDRDRLPDTPHRVLHRTTGDAKKTILKHEPLFIKAAISRLPSDCWHYIEAMLNAVDEHSGAIRRASVAILLRDQLAVERRTLHTYLLGAIGSLATSKELLGLSNETEELLRRIPYSREARFISLLEEHVTTPIIKRIVQLYRDPINSSAANLDLLILECLGQRNSLTHTNEFHDSSMIGCKRTSIGLAARLRLSIVKYTRENPKLSYREVLRLCGAA
ncbi:MAG: hypothetical protein LKM36_01155 [Flavobacteriales bacterium]|jgi:hypothetical protein|nr:hypothetical protein [Flavobacteriales bacterium]